VIEREFFAHVVDEPASRALNVLIERDQSKLTEEMRVAWTGYLMAARVRSPEKVERIQREARREMDEALLRDPHEYEAIRRPGGPSTLLDLAEQICKPRLDNSGKIVLCDVIQHPEYARAIIQMKWGHAGRLGSETRAAHLRLSVYHDAWRDRRSLLHHRISAASKVRVYCDKRSRGRTPPFKSGS
jgi:hypothetical protein